MNGEKQKKGSFFIDFLNEKKRCLFGVHTTGLPVLQYDWIVRPCNKR